MLDNVGIRDPGPWALSLTIELAMPHILDPASSQMGIDGSYLGRSISGASRMRPRKIVEGRFVYSRQIVQCAQPTGKPIGLSCAIRSCDIKFSFQINPPPREALDVAFFGRNCDRNLQHEQRGHKPPFSQESVCKAQIILSDSRGMEHGNNIHIYSQQQIQRTLQTLKKNYKSFRVISFKSGFYFIRRIFTAAETAPLL